MPKPKPEPVSVLSTLRAVKPKNLADSTSTALSRKKSIIESRKNNVQQATASEVAFTLDLAFVPDRGWNRNQPQAGDFRNQSSEVLWDESDDRPVSGLRRTDKSWRILSDTSNVLPNRKNIRVPKSFGIRIKLFFKMPESEKTGRKSCQKISRNRKCNRWDRTLISVLHFLYFNVVKWFKWIFSAKF